MIFVEFRVSKCDERNLRRQLMGKQFIILDDLCCCIYINIYIYLAYIGEYSLYYTEPENRFFFCISNV